MLVEVVACSVEDVLVAERAGAQRVELCSALSEGGLTPSVGLVLEAKARSGLPIFAMLRPRGGGFVYSEAEFRTMLHDAAALMAAGADGLVLGILKADGDLDTARLQEFGGLPLVCHRAFDLVREPFEGLEALIELGFERVLTTGPSEGGRADAEALRRLRERSAGRIEVLAGGGIRSANVVEIVRDSGVDQVHLGPLVGVKDPWSGESAARAMAEHTALDENEVRATVDAVRRLG